jgi:hypothetical protein
MAKKKSTGAVAEYAGLTIGAIAASKVSNMNIPVPAQVKPLLPIVLGIFLAKRGGMMKSIGAGMIAVGGTKLIGAVAPNLGIGEGVSDYVIEGAGDYALAGPDDNMNGYQYSSSEPVGATSSNYALAGVDTTNPDNFG